MIRYFDLGKNKQLNEIVLAGSHDAGIMEGKGNIQTQDLDILGQAQAGVRVFDLRITAGAGSDGEAELKSFHAPKAAMLNWKSTKQVEDVDRKAKVKQTTLTGGAFGLGLTAMLTDARKFVTGTDGGQREFLILKFDKCINWSLIAETCIKVLGDTIYKGGGNLNTTTLGDLQGKVVVLFSTGGLKELGGKLGPKDGILAFKNLYNKKSGDGAYTKKFDGLQYYGKGGTKVGKMGDKVGHNVAKQTKLMEGAKLLGSPDVMGMMYWTTTGAVESIKKRNEKMWEPPNIVRLRKLWESGLQDYVWQANPFYVGKDSPAAGPLRKRFMPNIIMIDFADSKKCAEIYSLNKLAPSDLALLDD